MKTCGVCHQPFKIITKIDGVRKNLGSRKRCLLCSPFGKHNTSKINSQHDVKQGKCQTCEREYVVDRSKGHRPSKCNTCSTNDRRVTMKQRCTKYKGGKCKNCGYKKCPAALGFHHVDERTKAFGIGGAYNRSWEVLKKELDKCILLCANCHAEHHYGLITQR